MRIRLLAWTVDADRDATERVYREVGGGAAESCGCPPCRNFAAARTEFLPAALHAALREVGAVPAKEHAVRLVAPLETDRNLYTGTYVFCGSIVAGRPYRGFPFLTEKVDVFESIGDDAHLALRPWSLPVGPWHGRPCLQLEFLVLLPWLLRGERPPIVNLDRGHG